MTTMNHVVSPEDVMALLDGELTPEEAAAVAEHVVGCATCSRLADDLRTSSSTLAEWRVEDVPGRVQDRLWEAVARELGAGADRAQLAAWRDWIMSIPVLWWGAGAAVAVLLMVAVLVRGSRPPTGNEARLGINASPPASRADDSRMAAENVPEPARVAGVAGMASDAPSYVMAEPSLAGASVSTAGRSTQPNTVQVKAGPMIARSISLTMEVKDVETARAAMEGIIGRHHGYAASLNVYTTEREPRRVQASLRVPVAELAGAVGEMKVLGRVESETQAGEEVGEQHADLEARLKTARATEESFRAILRQRSGTVADVMNVQEGIERVRGEIERMESVQQGLEHRVAFASVDLRMSEHEAASVVPVGDSVPKRMHRALAAGYENVTGSLLGFVLFAMEYGPVMTTWLLLLAAPVVVILLWRRKRARAGR